MRALAALLLTLGTATAAPLKPAATIDLGDKGRLQYMGYCAAKNLFIGSINRGDTALYTLDVAKARATKLGVLSTAHEIVFSDDCSSVALGVTTRDEEAKTQTNEVHIFDLTTKTPTKLVAFGAFKFPVSALAFVDRQTLAIGLNRGPVELWSLASTPRALATRDVPGNVMSLAAAHGLLAVGTYEGHVVLLPTSNQTLGTPLALKGAAAVQRETGSLDTTTGDVVMPGGGRVFDVAFVGQRLLASSEAGSVVSWSFVDGKPGALTVLVDKLDGPNRMIVSPDGQRVIVAENSRVAVWSDRGKQVSELGKLDMVGKYVGISGFAFAGPRVVLVGGFTGATIRVFRVK